MNLYIVRHGETDWNVEGRYAGQIDVPLNQNGIKQAEKIKEKLKDISFEKVYSSTLTRAITTAKIIRDGDIITDERIMERSNGDLDGRLKTEVKDLIDYNNPYETRYHIESIIDFRKRVEDFFDDITSLTDENILVVTHAGVGIYARCYFEGEPLDGDYSKYKIGNCKVLQYHI